MRSSKTFFTEVLGLVVLLGFVVVPIRLFIFQPFVVSGESMLPTLQSGDYLIIDELSVKFNSVRRGEIVILRPPTSPNTYFVKRVIGLPGETVEIRDGRVAIFNAEFPEGITLTEEYLYRNRTDGNEKTTLRAGEYFVMGDNRGASFDSRRWGVLPSRDIAGRALARLFPIQRFTVFLGGGAPRAWETAYGKSL